MDDSTTTEVGRRYAVTGAGGQLGRCLVRSLSSPPYGRGDADRLVAAWSHAELDIADADAVARALDAIPGGPPDVLVNAAAYNAVDACEGEGRETAARVNAAAPGLLAEACVRSGTRFVHVSTDYVLKGEGPEALPEDAVPAPESAYGRSKLEGERRVAAASADALIVRTSWVFGPGRNFVGAILRQARLRRCGEVEGPMNVVDDQWGSPTYAADLAEGLRGLIDAIGDASRPGDGSGGIYHLCNLPPAGQPAGSTWWTFARAILDARGYGDIEIEKGDTACLNLAAKRPRHSLLGMARAEKLGVRMRPWPEALSAYLNSPDLSVTLDLTDPSWRDEPACAERR